MARSGTPSAGDARARLRRLTARPTAYAAARLSAQIPHGYGVPSLRGEQRGGLSLEMRTTPTAVSHREIRPKRRLSFVVSPAQAWPTCRSRSRYRPESAASAGDRLHLRATACADALGANVQAKAEAEHGRSDCYDSGCRGCLTPSRVRRAGRAAVTPNRSGRSGSRTTPPPGVSGVASCVAREHTIRRQSSISEALNAPQFTSRPA